MPPKGVRKPAGGLKNLAPASEQSRSRSSRTEPRETPIVSDTERESSTSSAELRTRDLEAHNNNNVITAPKPIFPFLGTLGTPHFTGIDIINFFINYEDMYEDHGIKEKKRVRRCPRYCEEYIAVAV